MEKVVRNNNFQKILGKQHVKFAKKLFGTTSCKILIGNDHLQNLQQTLVGKNCPKKVCNQTTTYQKIYQEENADFTWFTSSSLNKLITYTATTFFTVNNVEQRSGTG